MNLNFDYLTSTIIGLFIGSLVLFLGRLLSFPISGILLAIIISALSASFLYNPSNKRNPNHRTLRGTMSSFLLCLIFSIFLTGYYIPKFSSILGTADISLGLSLVIVLLITVIGGIILGSFGGSIVSTFRDLVSVIYTEKRK